MEPAVDSDEEDTIRYAGYTAVMLAPERGAINQIDYAQLGEDDGDIQMGAVDPDANGNHVNGNHLEGFSDDDEEPPKPAAKPPAPSASVAPAPAPADAPRPLLSRDAPMPASHVSDVLEAMAGIQLRGPPPAWLMSSEWQTPLHARVPHLKAPAAPAPTTQAAPTAPASTPVAATSSSTSTPAPSEPAAPTK